MNPVLKRWLTVVACVLYVLSPFDLVPEAALGPFGLADDAVAMLVGLKALLLDGRKLT